jgi:hypothetical protein
MPAAPTLTDPHLLMAEDGPRTPVLSEPCPAPTLRPDELGPTGPAPSFLWDDGADPNDLALQRWGVVLPEGPGAAPALAALEPLLRLRASEQDGVRPLVYHVPPITQLSEAVRWRRRSFEASATLADLPRYLLIVGDLHEVSEAVQAALAVDAFVGRLPWTDPTRLAAYAQRLVAHQGPLGDQAPALHLHAVDDGTSATRHAEQVLIEPLHRRLRDDPSLDAALLHHLTGAPLSHASLRDWLATDGPAVTLTAAHGLGPPRAGWSNPAAQRERQGALCLGPDHPPLLGADLTTGPVWPGGVWFHLGCYSAGVPTHSAYAHWLDRAATDDWRLAATAASARHGLALPGTPPFVCALASEALANPQGPLAYVGHVDLAWSFSYASEDGARTSHLEPYADFFRSLSRGDRVGVAARRARRTLPFVEAQLGAWLDEQARGEPGPSPRELGMLWLLRNDLAAYLTLGDPAVRVRAPRKLQAPASTPRPSGGVPPLEQQLASVLAGAVSESEAANKLGMPVARFSELYAVWRRAGRKVLGERGVL